MLEVKNNQVKLTRGDVATLKIEVLDSSGEVYTLSSGDTLTFSMCKKAEDNEIILVKKFNDTKLNFLTEDTEKLEFGMYIYDVVLTLASGEIFTIIPTSTFEILKEVHLSELRNT